MSTTYDATSDPTTSTGTVVPDSGPAGRGWVLAGTAAGLLGIVGGIASGMVDAVYDPDVSADPGAITARLADKLPGMTGPVWLVVVSLGLLRTARGA